MESSSEDIPVSDIDEPRITERTIIDDDPVCSVCGEPAPFTANNVLGNGGVARVYKIPEHYSDPVGTAPGEPVCDEHYKLTAQYALESDDEG